MTTPIRTSAADKNLLSLNADTVVWYAGTDRETLGGIPYPIRLQPDDPRAWSSALKCSGRTDTHLSGIRAAQCMENAVDLNNVTHDCSFEGQFGVGGLSSGDQVITIKGGSHHVAFKGSIHSKGRRAHCVIGAWSDQSTAPSHHIDLSMLRVQSGEPLTVILGRVSAPLRTILTGRSPDIILPPGARIKRLASLGEQLYWLAKRAYVAIWYHR